MPDVNSKEYAILKITEEMVRQGGYNAFSFRDVASAVGIKSSSVHYHFATKEDLGAAVAKYYTDNFIESLGQPAELKRSGSQPLEVYIAAFRNALVIDKSMCLCGVFGAEIAGLPPAVVAETKEFFKRNLLWLSEAYQLDGLSDADAYQSATRTLSLLEGAMITSNVIGDISVFDQAVSNLNA